MFLFLGPAILPSLLICQIFNTGVCVSFTKRRIDAEHSLTCASTSGRRFDTFGWNSLCIESIITKSGFVFLICTINLFWVKSRKRSGNRWSVRETVGTRFQLSCTLFTGYIKNLLFRHVQYGLHDERRFTDSRFSRLSGQENPVQVRSPIHDSVHHRAYWCVARRLPLYR